MQTPVHSRQTPLDSPGAGLVWGEGWVAVNGSAHLKSLFDSASLQELVRSMEETKLLNVNRVAIKI